MSYRSSSQNPLLNDSLSIEHPVQLNSLSTDDVKDLIEDPSDGAVSLGQRAVYTVTLVISGVVGSVSAIACYCLYTQQNDTFHRILSDSTLLVLVILVIVICLIYFWEYLYEPIMFKMHPKINEIWSINKYKQDKKQRKAKCCNPDFYHVILNEFNSLKLTQNTISSFMCIIHQIFSAILIWSAVINRNEDGTYNITAFVKFFEAFSITLPGFALITYCAGREKLDDDVQNNTGSRASLSNKSIPWDARSKQLASQQSILKDKPVVITLLFALIIQFLVFITSPTLNFENFKSLAVIIYDCGKPQQCNLNPFFIINELIFRVFVGMTLSSSIFLAVANLLGDTIHHSALSNVFNVLNKCVWIVITIIALSEIDVIYTNNNKFEKIVDIIWIGIHGFSAIVALFCICKIHSIFTKKLEIEIDSLHSMNTSFEISVFIEGMIIWFLYLIYCIFLLLSYDSKINWHIIQQGSVFIFLTIETLIIYYLKQCENHPNYRKYFKPRKGSINWILVLQWCAILNLYDLIYSFIFAAFHFIELFSSNSSSNIYLQIAFSFSFASSHFGFWCLTMIIGILYRYYYKEFDDHIKNENSINNKIDVNIVQGNVRSAPIFGGSVAGSVASAPSYKKGNKMQKRHKFRTNSSGNISTSTNDQTKYDDIEHMKKSSIYNNNKQQVLIEEESNIVMT